jgi:hypothetical protein
LPRISASQIIEQWVLLEGAFDATFRYDLSELLHVKTWRWFWVRVQYLLRTDNPLNRHFLPPPEEEAPTFGS